MQQLKQGTAAVALVVSLGLAVPGTLGGSASADISDHNPKLVETTFDCDLDGNGTYETAYQLVSTQSSTMWQDTNSSTVIIQRLRVDVLGSVYTALPAENPGDPVGVDFEDPDVYWFDGPQDYDQGGGKPNGWTTVRCTEEVSYEYPATAADARLGIGFVEGARYIETDTNLYDVTISSPRRSAAVQAASTDEGKHNAKKGGKHRGKGKRGR
jgi:hypothetical protein